MSPPQEVLIVGTGLIGTSIGLALRRVGIRPMLADRDQGRARAAASYGAGWAIADWAIAETVPGMVVVAVPPAATARVVVGALANYPSALVTDVASVKAPILAEVLRRDADGSRYVGGHPMAGREVSGPDSGRADLFDDRPWVIAAHDGASEAAVRAVRWLATACGALPVPIEPDEHDRAVAVVSHAPQVLSSLLAARLVNASPTAVSIAGQGLRDMTRIAASDPSLWREILTANAAPVVAVLEDLRCDLDTVLAALADPGSGGSALERALRQGNEGRGRVPGKHSMAAAPTAVVPVVIPDRAGELSRVFGAVGELGVTIEDVRIEHVMGKPTGVVELTVPAADAVRIGNTLRVAGWSVRG